MCVYPVESFLKEGTTLSRERLWMLPFSRAVLRCLMAACPSSHTRESNRQFLLDRTDSLVLLYRIRQMNADIGARASGTAFRLLGHLLKDPALPTSHCSSVRTDKKLEPPHTHGSLLGREHHGLGQTQLPATLVQIGGIVETGC